MPEIRTVTTLKYNGGKGPRYRVLAKAISHRLIHALRIQARIGKIVPMGRDRAARVWRLPDRLV
jgi:hypothetical protein